MYSFITDAAEIMDKQDRKIQKPKKMACSLCGEDDVKHIVNFGISDRRPVCMDCKLEWTTHKYGVNEPYDKKQTNIDGIDYIEIYNVDKWPDGEGPDMDFCQK